MTLEYLALAWVVITPLVMIAAAIIGTKLLMRRKGHYYIPGKELTPEEQKTVDSLGLKYRKEAGGPIVRRQGDHLVAAYIATLDRRMVSPLKTSRAKQMVIAMAINQTKAKQATTPRPKTRRMTRKVVPPSVVYVRSHLQVPVKKS